MFDKLTERLQGVMESLRGRGRLTEENIGDTLRQVRMALLEADVALPVVKTFIDAVRAKVVGQELDKSLTPGQTLIRIINDELIALMGAGVRPLNLRAQPPVVILLAGLQGAGKTTTAAKLGKWLKENERKRVLLASTDVYRPAAILQLERLAAQLDIGFYPSDPKKSAVVLAGDRLVAAGCQLPLGQVPDGAHMGMRHRAGLCLSEETDSVVLIVSEETGRISLAVRGRLEAIPRPSDAEYAAALEARGRIEADIASLLARVDVLALPGMAITPPRLGQTHVPWPDGEELTRAAMLRLTQPFNLSRHAAIVMPVGTTPDGWSASLQLVGRDSSSLVAAALAAEALLAES